MCQIELENSIETQIWNLWWIKGILSMKEGYMNMNHLAMIKVTHITVGIQTSGETPQITMIIVNACTMNHCNKYYMRCCIVWRYFLVSWNYQWTKLLKFIKLNTHFMNRDHPESDETELHVDMVLRVSRKFYMIKFLCIKIASN